ncbi:hypothetical protein NG895_15005 [Aeoliella sp. ICT_H6.2]|uniref:Uncharacterized protein n=1 Tax=Aeoliella straminimaris TaxID=2954799 RepID=A0A9X2FB03_9BACT|nr:hypothetical protein [Aeoliella straminimaris]MCO6045219.1 hypothetical protein [Aeoliella straminimaris]
MTTLEMQPTFVLYTDEPLDPTLAKLRRAIRSAEFGGHAESAGPCLDFKVPKQQQRLWSPHLSVHLTELEQGGTELYCRFSPRPEIWTGVMVTYFAAVFVIFMAGIYAYVQWLLGGYPWALVAVPVAAAVVIALHLASLTGQQLSSDQMHELRTQLDRAMELASAQSVPAAKTAGME